MSFKLSLGSKGIPLRLISEVAPRTENLYTGGLKPNLISPEGSWFLAKISFSFEMKFNLISEEKDRKPAKNGPESDGSVVRYQNGNRSSVTRVSVSMRREESQLGS